MRCDDLREAGFSFVFFWYPSVGLHHYDGQIVDIRLSDGMMDYVSSCLYSTVAVKGHTAIVCLTRRSLFSSSLSASSSRRDPSTW